MHFNLIETIYFNRVPISKLNYIYYLCYFCFAFLVCGPRHHARRVIGRDSHDRRASDASRGVHRARGTEEFNGI